jgi:hypothetical protein
LPQLQKDPEIITYHHYLNHQELKKKALKLKSQMPDMKFGTDFDFHCQGDEKGIEPIFSSIDQSAAVV